MRLVLISDTHDKHKELGTLSGDVLIHAGDFCRGCRNNAESISLIDEWFAKQKFECILCIGGNHDFGAQELRAEGVQVFENAIYLEDEAFEFGGVTFYGTPWIPDLTGWAHYRPDAELKQKWDLIPDKTDVLITHTPPYGILDKPRSGRNIGSPSLRSAVERVSPLVHCFGHVHASPGRLEEAGVSFVNATVVNSAYEVEHRPTVLEIDLPD